MSYCIDSVAGGPGILFVVPYVRPLDRLAFLRGEGIAHDGRRISDEIVIRMPCGSVCRWPSVEQLPVEDFPCPCGDPTHQMIVWRPVEC